MKIFEFRWIRRFQKSRWMRTMKPRNNLMQYAWVENNLPWQKEYNYSQEFKKIIKQDGSESLICYFRLFIGSKGDRRFWPSLTQQRSQCTGARVLSTWSGTSQESYENMILLYGAASWLTLLLPHGAFTKHKLHRNTCIYSQDLTG